MKDLQQTLTKLTNDISAKYFCNKESVGAYIEDQVSDLIEVYEWENIEVNFSEEDTYRLRINLDFYDKDEEFLQHISFILDFHQKSVEESIVE